MSSWLTIKRWKRWKRNSLDIRETQYTTQITFTLHQIKELAQSCEYRMEFAICNSSTAPVQNYETYKTKWRFADDQLINSWSRAHLLILVNSLSVQPCLETRKISIPTDQFLEGIKLFILTEINDNRWMNEWFLSFDIKFVF